MKKQFIFLCMALMSFGTMAQVTVYDNTQPAQATQAAATVSAPLTGTGNYSPMNESYDYVDRENSWALGLNFNAGLGDHANAGLGLKLQYHATDAFRVEFGTEYFMESDHATEWDLYMNFHYLIRVYQQMYVYPILGVGFDHWHSSVTNPVTLSKITNNDGRINANIGVGYQYDLTDRFAATFEAKYRIIKDYNRMGVSLGIAYRF